MGRLPEYLSVGIVLKPHGLKGEIKVKPLTDEERRFDTLSRVYLGEEEGCKELEITARRYDKGFVYLKLEGLDTVKAVEPYRHRTLWIPRQMARILPKDTFFIADLIGCRARTLTGEDLGEITDVLETGGNDVYVVNGPKGEVLIPALKKVVVRVDLPEGFVVVDLTDMEGLLPDES